MRKGLTIGELLVTMAIIGVIAALVIPGFLKDYHKKLYTTKLHKSYEMLFSAIETACNDNNVSSFSQTPYASDDSTKWIEFLNKYFKTVTPATTSATGIFNNTYRLLSNTNQTGATSMEGTAAKAKLKGGESIALYCFSPTANTRRCHITLDINGIDEPNIGGRDMFRFSIDADNNHVLAIGSSNTCGNDAGGHGCLNKIIEAGWVMEY